MVNCTLGIEGYVYANNHLLKDITKVISKGRDRLLEIEVTGNCHIVKLSL